MVKDNGNETPAKKKLIKHLLKRDPSLKPDDISTQILGIKRFVKVVQKIYTEPQATISYKDTKVNGKIVKQKLIDTDIEELSKLNKGTNKPITIETIREFTQKVIGINAKKHGK